jgi:hypothetical protein
MLISRPDLPRYREEHKIGRVTYYICGNPGLYAVKTAGNNRVVQDQLPTIEHARQWIYQD